MPNMDAVPNSWDLPAYHRQPRPVVTTGGGSLTDTNKIAQTEWQYTEAHYYTEEAAKARMADMAAYIKRALKNEIKNTEPKTSKSAPEKLSEPLLPADNQPGDGSRWDEL